MNDNWISVEDRLPENDDDVLAVFVGWDDLKFQRVLDYDRDADEWSDWRGDEYKTVIAWRTLKDY